MKETARIASILLLLFLLFSCAPREAVRPPLPPGGITPAFLIGKITYDQIKTLNATVRIRMYQDNEFFTYLTGVLNFERPDLFSSSLFGPFGVTVMKMLIADDSLEIYLPNKDTLFAGGMKVPSLLPDRKTFKSLRSEVSEDDKDFILTFFREEGKNQILSVRYFFSKDTLAYHRIEKYNGSRVLFTIEVKETTGENIPSKFSLSAGRSRFEVVMDNILINPEISRNAFAHIDAAKIRPLQDLLRNFAPNQ
jgi:hypothetical protein